ncbi:MAG TPA: Gfo/Idh/MocA family oxidoreductase [Candidatus Bathyarchaeia archaeon]|nr:Gfo/Idh/MocA family oxidoreductase [Candidatus Bathyarchaeia archaeon]
MNLVNIAVIGGGYWGKKVIGEILEVSRAGYLVKLSAVVDNSPITLDQCKKLFGPLNYQLDYQGILTDPNINAVHICSPNSTHFEIASEFLKRGKHVLVEKPLATKSSQAFELVRLARQKGLVLSTGHVHRFNNGVRSLRRMLENGVLGDLYYLHLRWTGLMARQTNREVISDLGPHPFDICNNLLNTWPGKISCKGRNFRDSAGYEMATIYAEHPDRLDATIELSWLDPEKHRDVTVVGSDGSAVLDCLDQRLFLQRTGSQERVLVVPNNTLREEIIHFTRCIEWNNYAERYPNLSSGLLGANVVKLLEAATKSLREECTVPVERGWEDPLTIQHGPARVPA